MTSVKADRLAALDGPASGRPAAVQWLPGTGRHILLPPVAAAIKPARDFTAAVLSEWDLHTLIPDAEMIASELASNAVRHGCPEAGKPVELAWALRPGELICVVTDASADPPVQAEPDLGSESGRGLQIIGAFADSWGWALLGPGRKAVWAALRLPAAR